MGWKSDGGDILNSADKGMGGVGIAQGKGMGRGRGMEKMKRRSGVVSGGDNGTELVDVDDVTWWRGMKKKYISVGSEELVRVEG